MIPITKLLQGIRIVALIVVLLFLWVFISNRAKYGIDFTDEGAYLAFASRLHLGDRLFVDELMTLTKPFELLNSIILFFNPNVSLLIFRYIGGGLLIFSLLIVTIFISFDVQIFFAFMLSIPSFLINNYFGLLTPSYNSISGNILPVLACIIISLVDPKFTKFKIIISGIFNMIAIIAYPPMIITFPLFSGIFLMAKQHRISKLILIIWFLSIFFAVSMILYRVGIQNIITGVEQYQYIKSISLNSLDGGILHLIVTLLKYLPKLTEYGVILMIVTVLVCVGLNSERKVDKSRALVLLYFSILSFYFLQRWVVKGIDIKLDFLLISFSFGIVALTILRKKCGTWISNFSFPILLGFLCSGIYAISTFYFNEWRSFISGLQAVNLIFPFALSAIIQFIVGDSKNKTWVTSLIGISLIFYFIPSIDLFANDIYRDRSKQELKVTFDTIKLKGIYTSLERVRAVDETVAFLKKNMKSGDYLLAYDDIPILYYLTDTKPSYALARAIRFHITLDAQKFMVKKMITENKIAAFAVRSKIDLSELDWNRAPLLNYENYPLNQFVEKNYQLVAEFFPFEIWRLNETVGIKI